jgi:hypothetical protein
MSTSPSAASGMSNAAEVEPDATFLREVADVG